MDASPLTQQHRPVSFQPKIVSLYEEIFETYDDAEPDFDDGFWREFFLLRPDKSNLRRRLENISVDDLLRIQVRPTIYCLLKKSDQCTSREQPNSSSGKQWYRLDPEMECQTIPPSIIVLTKRYTNPSSDIIAVLAGLDQVDSCFLDFVNAIEHVIRSGGSKDPHDIFKALTLLGLLANYNKFEFRNPYRLKFEDLVNERAIQKIILGLGAICSRSRDHYVVIQEDTEEGWTLSNTLKYIGLGVLAPSRSSTPTRNAPSTDDSKELFSALPETDACILLSAYDFTNANKLFANTFITQPLSTSKGEPPFSAFLSLTSYILHHAYRSPRSILYGHLNLITLRILLEDDALCTKIFSPDNPTSVRLCRQRPPFLPKTSTSRPLAATILDIAIDTITHNLRRRLSVPLYIATLHLIHRLVSHLFKTRSRFPYHWTLLWQTLLSLLRFLTTYADSIKHDPDLPILIDIFLTVLSLAVCSGDVFLPDTDTYDDLFYKIVENGHLLPRFKAAFSNHVSRPPSTAVASSIAPHTNNSNSATALIDTLISISNHFTTLLDEEKKAKTTGTFSMSSGTQNLSPKEVTKVIRKGCESLHIPEMEGLEQWARWREVDEKALVKKVGRQAVDDARKVVR
ncbi:MAG: hypothetical protein Q9168_008241 [Polycauliona sp. 1 TL-2023]